MNDTKLRAIRKEIFHKCAIKDPNYEEKAIKTKNARRKFNELFNAIHTICNKENGGAIEKKKRMKNAIQKFLSQNAACYLRLEDKEILRLYSIKE